MNKITHCKRVEWGGFINKGIFCHVVSQKRVQYLGFTAGPVCEFGVCPVTQMAAGEETKPRGVRHSTISGATDGISTRWRKFAPSEIYRFQSPNFSGADV